MVASIADTLWALFESRLFPFPSSPGLFNQYSDVNPDYDLPGADKIRRRNLRGYLLSFRGETPPAFLLVGEAAGPRGCRFSGVPFTSERQLLHGRLPFRGRRSALRPIPYSEPSGTVLWDELRRFSPSFFLWNAVPLHPHLPGKPLSVRTPKRGEIKAFGELLAGVVSTLKPQRVIALGRTAQFALGLLGIPCLYVRHPSQAGKREFSDGIQKALKESECLP